MAGDQVWRTRGVAGPVLLAVAADLLLNLVLDPARGEVALAGRLVTFAGGALLAFLLGRWLGTRTWPRRGRRLAARLLRRVARAPIVFLTERPDASVSVMRRTIEVVGFAAGTTVILVVGLTVLGASSAAVAGLASVFALFAAWGSFVFVPYWVYARMGIRQVDPVRWLITPLSRRYAERLKLSNGALLLLATGAVVNLAFRAGASGDEALVTGVVQVGHTVASILVVAATAVAYYTRAEQGVVRELEAEALSAGIVDGRGMTDGDFLPRLGHGATGPVGPVGEPVGPRGPRAR